MIVTELTVKIERRKFEPAFKSIRPSVVVRDNERCLKCSSNLPLEVHHVEGYKHNGPESLATLCYLCHGVAPMGREKFREWVESGESGIEILQRCLRENGVGDFDLGKVEKFCATLVELGLEFHSSKLRRGRLHKRDQEGRCEGGKPYGHYPGEAPVLARILAMRATGMYHHDIAASLTSEGIVARSGKPWHKGSIAQIVRRESKQTVKSLMDELFDSDKDQGQVQTP